MPDATPNPTPDPKPSKAARSAINQAWVAELTNSEQIAASAQKPEYLPQFIDSEISAVTLAKFAADVATLKRAVSAATQQTTLKEDVTGLEEVRKQALIEAIQNVQKRARQKYAASNSGVLKDYGVGKDYSSSRELLEQTATDILTKLEKDTLPAIGPAKIEALDKALKDYQGIETDQAGAQGDASKARALLEAAVDDIIARRREIQFAADAQWPHTDRANAGVRREFKLPPKRLMK